MKLGVVGLPNVGKSTLFNAITKAGAEAANYPFCTIEPNTGVVAVPDERLNELADMYHPKVWSRARATAKVWATSSFLTSASAKPSCMSSAALKIRISSAMRTA